MNQFTLVEFERQGDFEVLLPTIEKTVQAMVKKALDKAGADLDDIRKTTSFPLTSETLY